MSLIKNSLGTIILIYCIPALFILLLLDAVGVELSSKNGRTFKDWNIGGIVLAVGLSTLLWFALVAIGVNFGSNE